MTDALLTEIIEWDVVNWSFVLDFWEKNSRQDLSRTSALELGSRHGGLSLWLALKGGRVKCSDLEGPTPRANEKHARHGVADRIEYEAIDATNIPYRDEFDVVMFKSVLGRIGYDNRAENQEKAIRQMHAALKPGGELFFVENLAASRVHQFLRKRFVDWGNEWRYVTIAEMLSFLKPFADVKYETRGFGGAFGRTAAQQRFLGRLDRLVIDGIVPASWKYIIAGVARK